MYLKNECEIISLVPPNSISFCYLRVFLYMKYCLKLYYLSIKLKLKPLCDDISIVLEWFCKLTLGICRVSWSCALDHKPRRKWLVWSIVRCKSNLDIQLCNNNLQLTDPFSLNIRHGSPFNGKQLKPSLITLPVRKFDKFPLWTLERQHKETNWAFWGMCTFNYSWKTWY